MDIASLSMSMSQMNVQNTLNVTMVSKAIDQMETSGAALIKMMDSTNVPPVQGHIGGNLDIGV